MDPWIGPPLGKCIRFATGNYLYYSGSVSEEEAVGLGEALKSYYNGAEGFAVLFSKGDAARILSVVVREGIWNEVDKVSLLETMARDVVCLVGGYPLKLRLLNSAGEIKKELFLEYTASVWTRRF